MPLRRIGEFYRIWNEYVRDLERYGCQEEAEKGAGSCKTPLSLDIFLNNLVSQKQTANSAAPICGPSDIDANGSYSNARRALEEAD